MRRMTVFLVVGLVVAACGGGAGESTSAGIGSGAGDLETATRLVEQWTAAWNNNDGEALAAIFTEDATLVYTGAHNSTRTGRNEIAGTRVDAAHDLGYGEVTATEDGGFTCEGTYVAVGAKFASTLTFELDGDLIAHLVHHDELIIPGASDNG